MPTFEGFFSGRRQSQMFRRFFNVTSDFQTQAAACKMIGESWTSFGFRYCAVHVWRIVVVVGKCSHREKTVIAAIWASIQTAIHKANVIIYRSRPPRCQIVRAVSLSAFLYNERFYVLTVCLCWVDDVLGLVWVECEDRNEAVRLWSRFYNSQNFKISGHVLC